MTSSTPAAGHAGPITTKNVHGKATASDNNSTITKCGLGAIPRNLRLMPAHLIEAMPMLVLGVAALAWIIWRQLSHGRAGGDRAAAARHDLAVGLALAASWASVWALYAAYDRTAEPGFSTCQAARFYVPAPGAIALLGAWLLARLPSRASLAGLAAPASPASVLVMFGLGLGSFSAMRDQPVGGMRHQGGRPGPAARPGPATAASGPAVRHAIACRGTPGSGPASYKV